MNMIKMIFFDVDGTLVDHATGQISVKTREAVKRLRERGYLLCVATGRPTASLPDFGDLQFDAFCAFNGSLCYTEKEIIHSTPISPEDVQQVLNNATTIGRPVSVAVRTRMVANGIEKDLADYYRLAGLELTASEDFQEALQEPVYQIMVGSRESEFDALVQGTTGVKIAVSWERAVDIIPAASGKGKAIGKILEHFNLKPEQAMAFGDSYNDMEMLQTVGTGVAMGNAPEELKAVADDVCAPVSRDGIYHYCVEKGLI